MGDKSKIHSHRRLSAAWRQKRQAELDEEREGGGLIALEVELNDALHDLDLADQALDELREKLLEFKEQAARVILDAARRPEDDEVLQRAQDEIRALVIQPEEETR